MSDTTVETKHFPFPIDLSLPLTQTVIEGEDNIEFSLKEDIDTCDRLLQQEFAYDGPKEESDLIPFYVDGTDNFDSDLRDYYIEKRAKSKDGGSPLHNQIQENSDNFQQYLRKYDDKLGSTGNTNSPVPNSLKSYDEEDGEEEDDISTMRRNSELIESQILKDINDIERTLESIQYNEIPPDPKKKFVFDGHDAKLEPDDGFKRHNSTRVKVSLDDDLNVFSKNDTSSNYDPKKECRESSDEEYKSNVADITSFASSRLLTIGAFLI